MQNRIAENPMAETVGTMPWQDVALDEPRRFHGSKELCAALNLDYEVRTAPLINARTGEACRNYREVIRTDTDQTLGIVKPRYHPIQNVDAFSFLPEVAGEHGLQVVAGGIVDDGAKVWILTKLREVELKNRILPNGERDRIVHHLLFWNSHDGSSSRRIAAVPYAFWCANALAAAWRNAEATYSTRHSRSAPQKLDLANRQLAEAIGWLGDFEQQMLQLDAERIKRSEVKTIAEQVLADVHGAIEEAKEITEKEAEAKQRRLDQRSEKAERIARLFDGEGRSCRGETKLDAYQAITEFIDHHRARRRNANRMVEVLTGYNPRRLRQAALRRLTS